MKYELFQAGLRADSFKIRYDYYLRLVNEMEDHLSGKLEAFFEELKKEELTDWQEEILIDEVHFYGVTSINSLRKSFVLGIFSLFESHVTDLIDSASSNVFSIKDLKGSLTDRIKIYLKKTYGEEVSDLFTAKYNWGKVDNYSQIRNCIAHQDGVINSLNGKQKSAVDNLTGIKLKENTSEIEIEKEFCQLMLYDLRVFIEGLFDVLKGIVLEKNKVKNG
ncbi:hypothetical protein J32TS2_28010 [Shouchella clausii]|uniref:hypothetical protein n=1 Tax=Shouchella clausii TaxID=79880 RepID=UPI001B2E7EEF|nr:hypothetical protein [Shouchella clausii]GIN17445.1 hypothetical protein J32TS2_28010 [Shouchella clausii]